MVSFRFVFLIISRLIECSGNFVFLHFQFLV